MFERDNKRLQALGAKTAEPKRSLAERVVSLETTLEREKQIRADERRARERAAEAAEACAAAAEASPGLQHNVRGYINAAAGGGGGSRRHVI